MCITAFSAYISWKKIRKKVSKSILFLFLTKQKHNKSYFKLVNEFLCFFNMQIKLYTISVRSMGIY